MEYHCRTPTDKQGKYRILCACRGNEGHDLAQDDCLRGNSPHKADVLQHVTLISTCLFSILSMTIRCTRTIYNIVVGALVYFFALGLSCVRGQYIILKDHP